MDKLKEFNEDEDELRMLFEELCEVNEDPEFQKEVKNDKEKAYKAFVQAFMELCGDDQKVLMKGRY